MSLHSIIYLILYGARVVLAGFDPTSKTNLAVYWGQNLLGRLDSQQRLSVYCKDPAINIILIAFIVAMNTPQGQPVLNLANQGGACNMATQPFTCPQVEEDIKTCQSAGKTILLSLGGDQGSGFSYTDEAAAKKDAQKLWQMFGPDQKLSGVVRPFGAAVVDGIDFDIESEATNTLRNQMRTVGAGETCYISASPSCAQVPGSGTSTMQSLLDGVQFDMVFGQFYNGACDINGVFNFDKWNTYAKNRNTTFFVGLSAGASAAPSGGYVGPEKLKDVFGKTKGLERMAGEMLWDASQSWSNDMYHLKVRDALKATTARARRHWDARPIVRDD